MRRPPLDLYRLLRPLLFRLDAERSHRLAFGLLDAGHRLPGVRRLICTSLAGPVPPLPVDVLGLHFPNPIGLAAGLGATKLVAVSCGILLHLCRVHNMVALLTALYVAVAIIPWTALFLTM